MVYSKLHVLVTLKVNGVNIEQFTSSKYFGIKMNEDCDIRQEIRSTIGQDKDAFMCWTNLFTSTKLSLKLRLRIMRCQIFPVFLCGCEN